MKEQVKIGLLTKHLAGPILKTWIGNIKGLGNIPKDQPFALAPNHSSYIEHFLIGAIFTLYLKRKIYYIAKKEHFHGKWQKFWHSLWENYVSTIPIDRTKGQGALKKAVLYLRKGKIVVIYPEGTRTLTGKLQKAKTGVARLALWAKVPVVPLGIIGTFEILPKGRFIPRLKKAHFNFGKPMDFYEYHNKNINKKILNEVTLKIMKEIAKLSKQKYNY